jgi:MerR family redox-sensitive transcriptional activator SoxR
MVQDEELTIGAVAERSGLATSALRFYEQKGLIAAERSEGNQRRYRRDVLRRLAMIQAAQTAGLSLEEIADALSELPLHAAPTKVDWQHMSATWKDGIERRIRILEGLRDQMGSCVACGCLSLRRCALVNPGDRLAAKGPGPRNLLP